MAGITVKRFVDCGAQETLLPLFGMDVYEDPDHLWARLKNQRERKKNHKEVEPLSLEEWSNIMQKPMADRPAVMYLDDPFITPLDETGQYQRIVCLSDTHSVHSYLEDLPPAHILLHAGDFSSVGRKDDCDNFTRFVGSIQHIPEKIVIAGNHDVSFDEEGYPASVQGGPGPLFKRFHRFGEVLDPRKLKDNLRQVCTYLEDEVATTSSGITVAGSPWQPWFCDWAFNLSRGQPCLDKWRVIPSGIDILMTHGPPLGHGDECKGGQRAGCGNLLEEIERRIVPKLHVFGHIHEAYGVTTNGTTIFANASNCNLRYDRHNLNPPLTFDVRIG